jgi:hypothetical protein
MFLACSTPVAVSVNASLEEVSRVCEDCLEIGCSEEKDDCCDEEGSETSVEDTEDSDSEL